jgi:hypothetical protein
MASIATVLQLAACDVSPAPTTVTGDFKFTPDSAIVQFSPNGQGGLDQSSVAVFIASADHHTQCQILQKEFTMSQDIVGLDFLSTQAVVTGTEPVLSAADAANGADAGVELTFMAGTADGDTTQINADQSGSATLTSLLWPTVLPDGGLSGGSADGTFSATIFLDGGMSGTVNGTFSATPCQ